MSSSLRKIAANRRNAQKSTGPHTPQGKAAVRFNACTHGLTSTQAVFFDEDPELYQLALRDFEDEYHPATPTELRLVHLIADSFWRLSRSRRVQSDFLRFLDRHKKACPFSHYEDRIAPEDRVAFLLGAERPTAFANFSLYETRFERTPLPHPPDARTPTGPARLGPPRRGPRPKRSRLRSGRPPPTRTARPHSPRLSRSRPSMQQTTYCKFAISSRPIPFTRVEKSKPPDRLSLVPSATYIHSGRLNPHP